MTITEQPITTDQRVHFWANNGAHIYGVVTAVREYPTNTLYDIRSDFDGYMYVNRGGHGLYAA